jgi:hypothetical protein
MALDDSAKLTGNSRLSSKKIGHASGNLLAKRLAVKKLRIICVQVTDSIEDENSSPSAAYHLVTYL